MTTATSSDPPAAAQDVGESSVAVDSGNYRERSRMETTAVSSSAAASTAHTPATAQQASPQQPTQPQHRPAQDIEAIKAAARAYALSGSSSKSKRSYNPRAAVRQKNQQLLRQHEQQQKHLQQQQQQQLHNHYPHYPHPSTMYPPPQHATAFSLPTSTAVSRLPKVTQHRTTIPSLSRRPPHLNLTLQKAMTSKKTSQKQPNGMTPTLPLAPYPPAAASASTTSPHPPPVVPMVQSPTATNNANDNQYDSQDPDEWEDYHRFVQSLNLCGDDDTILMLNDDDEDDADEFQLDLRDDDDDDDDEEEEDDDDDDERDNGKEPAAGEVETRKDETTGAAESTTSPATNRDTSTSAAAVVAPAVVTATTAESSLVSNKDVSSPGSPATRSSTDDFDFPELGPNFYEELAEELGWLEEEDMEAAVATLLDHTTATSSTSMSASEDEPAAAAAISGVPAATKQTSQTPKPASTTTTNGNAPSSKSSSTEQQESSSPSTPLREARAAASRIEVTQEQQGLLKQLMEKHYQLLLQQSILAARAAHHRRLTTKGMTAAPRSHLAESADELVEILDGAVGMLQDLDQNRKDAIRHFIQFEQATTTTGKSLLSPKAATAAGPAASRRSLFSLSAAAEDSSTSPNHHAAAVEGLGERRLTRAQFIKTLEQEQGLEHRWRSVFEIRGLERLNDTFNRIDKSVEGIRKERTGEDDKGDDSSILVVDSNMTACQQVLDQSGTIYAKEWLPGARDVSECFVDATEILGKDFKPPCTKEQEEILTRNRNLLTSGEDNLILRGVNLYGEKQWILLGDRFLPDRSVNLISQRYSKLCVLLYKANGIAIGENGDFTQPPKLESVDDVDEKEAKKLKMVRPPAVLNVHRWSMEEDLTILKSVPVFGSMWAEIAARFLPHRDRGHIRKRYLVLERRVKATLSREKKHEEVQKHSSVQRALQMAAESLRASNDLTSQKPLKSPHLALTSPKTKESKAHVLPQPPRGSFAPHLAPCPPAPFRATGLAYPPSHDQPIHLYRPQQHYHQHQHQPPLHQNHQNQQQYVAPTSPPAGMNPSIVREEGSRAAFEHLVEEADNEWSQLSRMQRMMETDTESMIAGALVTQLARAPAENIRSSTATTLCDVLDSGTEEFSMLDSYRPTLSQTKGSKPDECGLLGGVLKMARERQGGADAAGNPNASRKAPESGLESLSSAAAMSLMPPPLAAGSLDLTSAEPGESPEYSLGSPKKRRKGTLAEETPSQKPFSPASGTPTKFSPAFRSIFSPGTSLRSPPMSFSHPAGGELSNLFQPGQTMDGYNMNGVFDINNNNNNSDSQQSVGSIKLDEHVPQTPSPVKASPSSAYSGTPLFGEEATLMENDLEAISALNSLSSSPAAVAQLPSSQDSNVSSTTAAARKGDISRAGKSLFATVVGNNRQAGGIRAGAKAAAAGGRATKKRKLQF